LRRCTQHGGDREEAIVDVTLGSWTAEASVDEKERKPLTVAMADAARNKVKNTPGFTPKDAAQGKPAKAGFTISGKLTNVLKSSAGVTVKATFTLWVDGTFSNVKPLAGEATASGFGTTTAEEALRAVTESRVKTLLDAIKSGRAAKAS
jgi:hypothetical protein